MMIARQRVARVRYGQRRFSTCSPSDAAKRLSGVVATVEGAIPLQKWQVFNLINLIDLTKILKQLAASVNLAVFLSHPRSTKKTKKWVKKTRPTDKPHVFTATILSQNKTQKQTPWKGLVSYSSKCTPKTT
ncbi:hypothetical protein [Pleurocapsa sp. FMAR1]|uniref:hypothetical protein n=1 Tax=Pleurocapsa sp. FMAR1 TaxID=3040204 RepID=UPI0029C9134B|nr:hypothetical protein [Pleurocapsa sp. FMAR1]